MAKTDAVKLYDPDTRTIVVVQASELRPGMVPVQMEDSDEPVWMETGQLQPGDYEHEPFSQDVLNLLKEIKASLDEVYPLSLEDWEDGFRRDHNAEQEIALWLHLSRVYSQCARSSTWTPAEKIDIFRTLATCATSPRNRVFDVLRLTALSRKRAKEVVKAFYGEGKYAPVEDDRGEE